MKTLQARSQRQLSRTTQLFSRLSSPIIAIVFVSLLVVIASVGARFDAAAHQGRDEVRIELSGNGFTPSEVQHAPGSFAIAVDNTTLSNDYKLRLKAEDGTLLHEVEIQKGSSAWTVNLQTGRYTLTEINHSQWVCTIVVQ